MFVGTADESVGRLRILIVTPSAVAGGMEEIVFNLAVCLPTVGLTPHIISLQAGPLVERLRGEGVEVELIEAGRLRDARRFGDTTRRIRSLVRSSHYDLIFSSMSKAHLYVALAARRLRVPALWCQAGHPDPVDAIDRVATLLPTAGVVALSRDTAAAQRRLSPARMVHVLHPGIDLRRFVMRDDLELRASFRIPPEAILVALVGRLQPWKGQREFLAAASLMAESHPTALFAIVGGAILGWEGDYPEELKRLAARLGLRDRVIFTGHTADVHRWMAAANIVVNASQPEPFGLVVIEAMASGCAVVAVARGGPRDIITDGHSGLLCSSREPAVLARAMARLVGDGALRARLGRSARSRVEADFSREGMAERFRVIARDSLPSPAPRAVEMTSRSG